MRGTMVALLLGGLLTIGVGQATADVIIYGTSLTNANASTFYTIDATTTSASIIGPANGLPIKDPSNGKAAVSTITATAFDNNGVLWAIGKSDNGGSGNALYQVNTTPIPNGGNPFIAATNIVNLTGTAASGMVSSMSFSSTNRPVRDGCHGWARRKPSIPAWVDQHHQRGSDDSRRRDDFRQGRQRHRLPTRHRNTLFRQRELRPKQQQHRL